MATAGYWPWWLGAASFAIVTVGSCIVARRPLGVSGIIGRFVDLRAELRAERQRRFMAKNEAALEAMLAAATAEAFGRDALAHAAPADAAGACEAVAAPAGATGACAPIVAPHGRACGGACHSPAERPTLAAHAAFLLAIVAGGLTVQLARGSWRPTLDIGPAFAALFGGGAPGAAVLGLGGVLVGIGTALSGGCSTGHGLSGCSRLQPASVVATALFFASAVAVSFLLRAGLA